MIRALLLLLLLISKSLLLNQLSMRAWGCGNQLCLVGAAPTSPLCKAASSLNSWWKLWSQTTVPWLGRVWASWGQNLGFVTGWTVSVRGWRG